MSIERKTLYRLPWSMNDNAGGWVEVTDECDLHCPGCYRHRVEGHRPLNEVKEDILLCQKLTNCDRMAVAGGEPLLYPDILEVIDFIRSHKMFALLEDHYHGYKATTYLNGTADPETLKFLVTINIGSPNQVFGIMGPKSVEIVQNAYHLLKGRYCAFTENTRAGKKLFLLSFVDKDIRRAFYKFARSVVQRPRSLTEKIYIQSISLQQPNEYLNGVPNLCDGCMNMMVYKGKLIHSCRLDEYRIFGGLLSPVEEKRIKAGTESYSGLMRQVGQKEDI